MNLLKLLSTVVVFISVAMAASAQGTAFTYQGRVMDNGTNFSGPGQFEFALVTSTNASHTATATANAPSGGYITGYNLIYAGNGYSGSTAAVTLSGGGGSGAAAHANISGGTVTSITVDNPGNGLYTSTPTVTIAAPPANITYATYWSNDGTSSAGSEPSAAVSVNVAAGLFTVVLGDTTIANMTAISADLFNQPNLQLRIWFNDGVNGFAALSPVQNLTPAPYSAVAQSLLGALSVTQLTGTISPINLPNGIGGTGNTASGTQATVGGGYANAANGFRAAVGGGNINFAGTSYATVAGGSGNTASGGNAPTVGGGLGNNAINYEATVSGGYQNTAGGLQATVGGGYGNNASGSAATVPGGESNVAGGDHSFAAGFHAQALYQGDFVWADSQNAIFASTANDQFCVRAQGGVGIGTANPQGSLHVYSVNNPTVVRIQSSGTPGFGRLEFVSNPQGDAGEWRPGFIQSTDAGSFTGGLAFYVNGTGVGNRFATNEVMRIVNGRVGIGTNNPSTLLQVGSATCNGTTWANASDRNAKENFKAVDAQEVLAKVAALPLSRWNYKEDKSSEHLGPMAQDFYAAFNVGADDRHITTVDEGGVALAAIQGLNQKLEQKETEITELKARLEKLEQLMTEKTGGVK